MYKVKKFVDKPKLGTALSNKAITGRYIFTPEIFRHLDVMEVGADGEIQLTVVMGSQVVLVYAYEFEGNCYDLVKKLGLTEQ